MIRVAIAEDHPEMRLALRLLLRFSEDIELVCEATNGEEAVECVQQSQPDVLVMDNHMPGLSGLAATKQINELAARTRVILISAYRGEYIISKAVDAGAKGYIPKDEVGTSLLVAIKAVHQGETFFVK